MLKRGNRYQEHSRHSIVQTDYLDRCTPQYLVSRHIAEGDFGAGEQEGKERNAEFKRGGERASLNRD